MLSDDERKAFDEIAGRERLDSDRAWRLGFLLGKASTALGTAVVAILLVVACAQGLAALGVGQ